MRYLERRVDEYRAVLGDAAERFAAMDPELPRDYLEESIEVEATFGQAWGSTAGGFPGIGGSAITSSQTWVIRCQGHRTALVYFGARLAHATDDGGWLQDRIKRRRFPMSHLSPIKPGDPLPIRHAHEAAR